MKAAASLGDVDIVPAMNARRVDALPASMPDVRNSRMPREVNGRDIRIFMETLRAAIRDSRGYDNVAAATAEARLIG